MKGDEQAWGIFLLQVDAGFRFLERTPLVFPAIYRGLRRHLIKRFPYKIFYLVEETAVVIFAVVYGGRDPQWIRKRLALG
jgi:plasmid stabilization system protein ParE